MVGSAHPGSTPALLVADAPGMAAAGDVERRRWAPVVAAGTVHCRVCHGLIDPAAPWNFGSYGESLPGAPTPEHRRCNDLSDGGVTPAA
jgi:hypothetical protein